MKCGDSTMKLVYLFDKQQIINLENAIWDICQLAYEPIGGFKSLRNKRDIRTCKLVKIVWTNDEYGNSIIGACALYRQRPGEEGYRGIGYAGNINVNDYRECVQEIIKDDIANFDKWFYVEASRAIEHYFEKHDGYAIPNVYVPEILGKDIPKECLLDDGFKYMTTIGPNENSSTEVKQMFGFKNKAIFDKLMDIYGSLDDFSRYIKELKLGIKNEDSRIFNNIPMDDINIVTTFVYNFDDCVLEYDLNEVPSEWIDLLDYAINVLESKKTINNKTIQGVLDIAYNLKGIVSPIYLGVIHAEKPIPHSTYH
ncbi:MAG: hypothetical protein MJZ34_10530 [Paludibacteraceae bacterium]|nr:hypothetical protein [Paludibacteraceae bacterium]